MSSVRLPSTRFTGMYNQEELTLYLQSLRRVIDEIKTPITHPISLILNRSDIFIKYYPEKKNWSIEGFDEKEIEITGEDRLAKAILQQYNYSKTLALTTEFICEEKTKQTTENISERWTQQPEWKQINNITTEKIIIKDDTDRSLLYRAAESGDSLGVDLLLKHKANPTLPCTNSKDIPLIVAAEKGYVEIVNQILKDSRTNINQLDDSNSSALFIAVRGNKHEIMRLLIKQGADLKFSRRGSTLFDEAHDQTTFQLLSLYELIAKEDKHPSLKTSAAKIIDQEQDFKTFQKKLDIFYQLETMEKKLLRIPETPDNKEELATLKRYVNESYQAFVESKQEYYNILLDFKLKTDFVSNELIKKTPTPSLKLTHKALQAMTHDQEHFQWFIEKRAHYLYDKSKKEEHAYYNEKRGQCSGFTLEAMMAFLNRKIARMATRYQVLNDIPSDKLFEEVTKTREQMKRWSAEARKLATREVDTKDAKDKHELNARIQHHIQAQKQHYFKHRSHDLAKFEALLEMNAATETGTIAQSPEAFQELFPYENELYYLSKLPDRKDHFKYENAYVFTHSPLKLYQIKKNEEPLELKIDDEKRLKDILTKIKVTDEVKPFQQTISSKELNQIWSIISKNPGHIRNTKPFTQNASKTLPLIMTEALETERGVTSAKCFSGIYSLENLRSYFHSLQITIEDSKPPFSQPVFLALSNRNHDMGVGYDPLIKSWTLMDANQTKLLTSNQFSDEKIAEEVMNGFSSRNLTSFRTNLYVSKTHEQEFKPILDRWQNTPEWKNIHLADDEKSKKTDDLNTTWLWHAAISNDISTVRSLLEQGADPLKACGPSLEESTTPLDIAVILGNNEMFNLMTDYSTEWLDLDNPSPNSPPLLYTAAEAGHIHTMKLLIETGAHPTLFYEGETLFANSCFYHAPYVVQCFLDNGVNPNQKDSNDISLLTRAYENNKLENVKVLLSHPDMDPQQLGTNGIPLVETAVSFGQTEITRLFLERGINPDMRYNGNTTLLAIAFQYGQITTAKLLLYYGADTDLQFSKINPVDDVKNQDQQDIVRAMKHFHELNALNATPETTRYETIEILRKEAKDETDFKKVEDKFAEFKVFDQFAQKLSSLRVEPENKEKIDTLIQKIDHGFKQFQNSADAKTAEILPELMKYTEEIASQIKSINTSSPGFFKAMNSHQKIHSILEEYKAQMQPPAPTSGSNKHSV